MGGHAFHYLHCPRMPPSVYSDVKSSAIAVLQTIFTHVTVPHEVPGKRDYGDVDFLVSAPFGRADEFDLTTFPFEEAVNAVKKSLNTPHGRQGILTPTCMYFAVPMPSTFSLDDDESDDKQELWVQIDAKVCFNPKIFSWMEFELNHATQSSILGCMINPLGLTINRQGLHIRVEEIESTNWPASIVTLSQDAWTVARVLGLSRRVIDGGFESAEEIFEEYASMWLFHPGSFQSKLDDEANYIAQHRHRARFLQEWLPARYPGLKRDNDRKDLPTWTARTRKAVREKIFTTFPHAAVTYYIKLAAHTQELEERTLREKIIAAIPQGSDGWDATFTLPHIIVKDPLPSPSSTPEHEAAPAKHGELTPPPSPPTKPTDHTSISLPLLHPPVRVDALLRTPPYSCKPSPPPTNMAAPARLACLARWTAFTDKGAPYLLISPHPKDYELQWREAIEAGLTERKLVRWARGVWWTVWVRQCVVNWRGMWANRMEKEDKKVREREKILERLTRVNAVLGLVEVALRFGE